jgi:hypothetical protein
MKAGGSIAALVVGAFASALAAAETCDVPASALDWSGGAGRIVGKLKARQPASIVLLGADFAVGAFAEDLGRALGRRFPNVAIDIRSRALAGARPADMLIRIERDVMAERPDLVIWEPGTYNVGVDGAPAALRTVMRDGIMRLRHAGIGVLLIEPGAAPDFVRHAGHEDYVEALRALAFERDVPLYRRFDTSRLLARNGALEGPCVAEHVAAMLAKATR